ncbi:ABC transporter [Apiospora marii]|uniref:ABC transporter n=1 Tax=Apiospora marii TaxID=335849 RepID=A0ABR1R9R9_9PEZI
MVGIEAALLHAATTIIATAFSTAFIARAHLLLEGSPIRKSPRGEGWLKLAIAIALFMVHNSLVSLTMSGWAASALLLVLLVEQYRGSGPSDVATLYYFASIITDAVFLRNLVDDPLASGPHRIVLVRCLGHACLLALELLTKSPAYEKDGQPLSPEERHGIISRAVFAWVNPVLARGYTRILSEQDMPVLSRDMTPKRYRGLMIHWWSQRDKADTKYPLHRALFWAVRKPFLAAILPRTLLIVFRYCQPSLMKETIRYVAAYPEDAEDDRSFRLVLAAVVIYVGLAISTAAYQHRINRLKLATRSALVGLIHTKTMILPSLASDNGETTTLMSTYAESLDGIGEMAHETWAQVVEVVIGIVLLVGQVGWIWPLPLFLIYLCSHVSRFVARNLQPGQTAWNLATQNRIAATSSMLGAIKTVKMLGMQSSLYKRIETLRAKELSIASRLRWVMVYYNASANALGIFSPAITLALYAVLSAAHGNRLDTETAFTTMAILSMVTHPANMVMTIVPRAVAALAGFGRIQEFMLRPSLPQPREILPEAPADTILHTLGNLEPGENNVAVRLCNVTIGANPPLLSGINTEVPAGALTIISGPTGSGKSTLIRAILGEVVPVEGTVNVSTSRAAYCAQRPWLPNGTIKEAIYGFTDLENANNQDHEAWYGVVTKACCLTQDFDSLIDEDQTQIGSRGLNLSGGQRQRVTLARALFAKCDIFIVDDVLSGLDGDTEQAVFDNIFGAKGLLRQSKTTIILVTNSAQYFQSADHVVVLGNGGIIDQGPWGNLHITLSLIAKFSSDHQAREKNDTALSESFKKLSTQVRAKDEIKADLSRQSGDPALYGLYLKFVGWTNVRRVVACTATYAFFITIPQYWLQMWTESGGASTTFYASGYLFIAFMAWASTSMQMWSVLIQLAPRSGSLIHKRLLDIITGAPLAYFSQTDNGSILNRFSQDIQVIDKQLPGAFQTIVTQIFKLLVQVIFLCLAEKWLALSLPTCAVVVYVVQKLYLRTSRQLRYLELESRAGVFSSFLESVEGLETIRAFGWSTAVCHENIACVDKSQRPEFLLLCLQRWLGVVLDLMAAGVATTAVAMAVFFRESVTGAQVGIALNVMLVANSTLLKLVESWTALETSLGAVARLKALEKTVPSEKGRRQKLIIFGRTGSGKSTLLLTLLRLLELQSGTIELDGVDIKQVSLDLLRQRCFVTLSQNPLLLQNETVRFNLDPDGMASGDTIVSALEMTGLWPHFRAAAAIYNKKPKPLSTDIRRIGVAEQDALLDRQLAQFPEMSVGQTQLFALSRALIKAATLLQRLGARPVVLLDEATSSLDTATESAIYRIIDEELTAQGHTVIIVAHRLGVLQEHTRTGRDTVVSMADGRLVSVDML